MSYATKRKRKKKTVSSNKHLLTLLSLRFFLGLSNKVGELSFVEVWIDYHEYTQLPKSINKQRLGQTLQSIFI